MKRSKKHETFAGKGGVGKTLIACARALYLAENGQRVLLIDYDGGHSVATTLGLKEKVPSNRITKVQKNLYVAVIDNEKFTGIGQFKENGGSVDGYLDQFPDHLGIVAFCDMVNEFFGIPTDVAVVQKFSLLTSLLASAEEQEFDMIIVDVEPTAGLERLLKGGESMSRSLMNLGSKGVVFMTAVRAAWPDIAAFLKSSYMVHIGGYSLKLLETTLMFRNTSYYLVSTPEMGPAKQTFTVRSIIEPFCVPGVKGIILNNIRGEDHEGAAVDELKRHMRQIVKVPHLVELHNGTADRTKHLATIGQIISSAID